MIKIQKNYIYIPIWLDLLFNFQTQQVEGKAYLHSNMVRFIMQRKKQFFTRRPEFTFQYG